MNSKGTILILTLLRAAEGFSQGILDQSFEPVAPNVFADTFNGATPGQTFTVGFAGILTEVDVFVFRNEIQPANSIAWTLTRLSSGDVLASGFLDNSYATSTYSFEPCMLAPGAVQVSAGDVLALRLSSSYAVTWAGNNGNPYARGFELPSALDSDLGFRTYVFPIPEPDSLALISIGTALVFWKRRSTDRDYR
jgi:hypothetical protein